MRELAPTLAPQKHRALLGTGWLGCCSSEFGGCLQARGGAAHTGESCLVCNRSLLTPAAARSPLGWEVGGQREVTLGVNTQNLAAEEKQNVCAHSPGTRNTHAEDLPKAFQEQSKLPRGSQRLFYTTRRLHVASGCEDPAGPGRAQEPTPWVLQPGGRCLL